jgi:hypothetical protein
VTLRGEVSSGCSIEKSWAVRPTFARRHLFSTFTGRNLGADLAMLPSFLNCA